MRADEVELQSFAILVADGYVGEGAKASGDAVDCLGGILHHVADGLSAALDQPPRLFGEVDLAALPNDGVERGQREAVTVQVDHFTLLHYNFGDYIE
jgi:hypothetical protein